MDKYNGLQLCKDYRRIERAIRYLDTHFRHRPSPDEIAVGTNLSRHRFHRVFNRWAGISPGRFLRFLTLEYTRQKLAESRSLPDVSPAAGLSGPVRRRDLFVTFDAMTPGEFKRKGKPLRIEYGFHATPFGGCLLAMNDRRICRLSFTDTPDRRTALNELQTRLAGAILIKAPETTHTVVRRIFGPEKTNTPRPFHLMLKGTDFQVNVWRALLTIPEGCLVSYQDLAADIGRPAAVRAVAGAVAANPVAYLIPCHRVISKSGHFHGYRWGTARKKALLAREAANAELRNGPVPP